MQNLIIGGTFDMIKKLVSILTASVITISMIIPFTVSADKWVKTDNGYKYGYNDGTYAKTGWLTIGSDKYYIQKDGTRKTGWLKTKDSSYLFGSDGKMKKGLTATTSGDYYYFDDKTGKMWIDTRAEFENAILYFGFDGKLKGYSQSVNEDMVCIYNDDKLTISWLYEDDGIYYTFYDENEEAYCVLTFDYLGELAFALFSDGTQVIPENSKYYVYDKNDKLIDELKITSYNPLLGKLPPVNSSNSKK